MKLSSPQHAQNRLFLPISDERGRFFFHVALVGTFSCSAGAIFLSLRSLDTSCRETGSASTGFPRPVEETDDTFAGGGWLGETDNAFVSGTCPVSAVCERSVGQWCRMVWMAGVVGLRDDASSRRSARPPHWCGGAGGTGGPGCGARGWRKNGHWTHAQPHFRYKTHPADPFSPHARYKTRPADPEWPFLARFSHAWRTLYRCRHQQATHGELCTACEAETGLAITAHQAPQVWRAPEGIEKPGCGARGRWLGPAPEKSHAIRLGEVSTKLENVAIPTI